MLKKSLLLAIVLVAVAVIFFGAVAPMFAAPQPPSGNGVTITLLDAPRNGEIHISVGESYTLNWHVESDTEFSSAVAVFDVYYPGRVISYQSRDQVRGPATSADLSLTITGKSPSSSLAEGYAPIFPVVAVRFGGQTNVNQVFNLKVYVTP
jgi:hypothetical protein